FLSDLIHVDKVVPEDTLSKDNKEMLQTVFGPGNSAFTIWLSSAASEILDTSFPDLNYGIILSLKDKDMGTFASVDQLTLMSASENKELSFELMKYMLNKDSMTKFHKHHPRAPISKDEPYQGDERLKEIIETKNGIYRPLIVAPEGVQVYENLWKHLQAMAAGQETYEEALNQSAEYANELLKKREK
ncbi:MAG: sugar ABC transporter substrate-binding protein, partial [Clostridiales bacterium]